MFHARVKSIPELPSNDVFENELMPLFVISRFIGLFSYDKNRKTSLTYSLMALSVHLIFAGLVGYLLYDASLFVYSYGTPFPDVQVTTYAICHGLNLILMLSHVVAMMAKRRTFQQILDLLALLDTLWTKHSALYSKKCTKLGLLAIVLFYLLIPLALITVIENNVLFYAVAFGLTEICFFLVVMQFCSVLEIIRRHLEELREDLYDEESRVVKVISRHQTLMGFCPVVNEAYSWQLLIMCVKFFLFSLIVAYLIILDNVALIPNIVRLIILLWEFALLFPIAKTCSEIEEEADNFNHKLFNLMRESKNLCSNDKLHLYVTMKQSVNFTACGFFALGYPLVTSIIAAATTYLVILVQFSMS